MVGLYRDFRKGLALAIRYRYHFAMNAIHIRNVPDDVLSALKSRAQRHERSLQGELRQILRNIARMEAPEEPLPPLKLHYSTASPETTWSREEMYGDDGR